MAYHIASINQDAGISPAKKKGAAVHLAAMRAAFSQLGADVAAIDTQQPAAVIEDLGARLSATGLDLIYERYAFGQTVGAEFASQHEIPFVLEVNAPLEIERKRYRQQSPSSNELAADAYLFSKADCVLAVSESVARYAAEKGASPDRIVVEPNGVDPSLFGKQIGSDSAVNAICPPDKVVVGFHGRLRPWHGFERVVSAVRKLSEQGEPVFMLVVGEGPFVERLEAELPSEFWHCAGWQPHELVPQYVRAFDILPLGYGPETDCYFSPLKLMEGMACGAVPVVPAIGDLPLAVRHNHNGLVYVPGDINHLAMLMKSLIHDAGKRSRLSHAAQLTAMECTWERIAERVLEFVGLTQQPFQSLGAVGGYR